MIDPFRELARHGQSLWYDGLMHETYRSGDAHGGGTARDGGPPVRGARPALEVRVVNGPAAVAEEWRTRSLMALGNPPVLSRSAGALDGPRTAPSLRPRVR
jgi:hypothetical protein